MTTGWVARMMTAFLMLAGVFVFPGCSVMMGLTESMQPDIYSVPSAVPKDGLNSELFTLFRAWVASR